MPDNPFGRLMQQGRGLSSAAFVRMLEADGPIRARDFVSITDLAADLGVSVRTIRRWNKLPDAPKRYRRGRRLMYRRADVQPWFEQRARRLGATQAGARATDAREDREGEMTGSAFKPNEELR